MSKGKKKIRAVLVDSKSRTVTDVEYDGDYKSIYGMIGCQCFTTIQLPGGDALYVDDEGLLRVTADTPFMQVPAYPQPIAGSGLILGCDKNGNSAHAKHGAAYYAPKFKFMSAKAVWLQAQFANGGFGERRAE